MKRLPDTYRRLIRPLLVSLYLIASIGSEAHRAWHDHVSIATTSGLTGASSATDHSLDNDSRHNTSTEGIGATCPICAHSMGIPLAPVVLAEAVADVRQPQLPVQDTGINTGTVSLLPGLRAPPLSS